MINILFLIPLFSFMSAVILYNQNGKKQFLKFDMVQFVYAFIISPMMFIWMKAFLFFLLRNELDLRLSIGEIFVADGVLSLIFMYVFAFVVIHSLTKTFNIKRESDPLYDMVAHSEYFHLNLSHLVIYLGGMLVVSLLSLINLFVPLDIVHVKYMFYSVLGTGLIAGMTIFLGIWKYESPDPNFMRIMKLIFAFFFMIHSVVYFVFDPLFNSHYALYWFVFSIFLASTFMSLFAERKEEKTGILHRMPFLINIKKPAYYYQSFIKLFKQKFLS